MYVSAVSLAQTLLTVRFVPDSIAEHEATDAFTVVAHDLREPSQTVAALEGMRDVGEAVFVSWRGDQLVVESESGIELAIGARIIDGGPAEINTAELRAALNDRHALYLQENGYACKLALRLQAVRDLLYEQARRLDIKSAAHAPESAAGVLYAQHRQFVERLLRETEN